jgi:hypothetical protein
MVNVDTVYQRVLALLNKEQRGYLTPQEFNLYANQAQMDIFEQYFYDLNQFGRFPGNDTVHADMVDIIEEKISIFEVEGVVEAFDQTDINGQDERVFNLNAGVPNLYRISNIKIYRNGAWRLVENVSKRKLREMKLGPLTRPSTFHPVYTIDGSNNVVKIYEDAPDSINVDYIKTPTPVNWTYVVVGEKALSNPDPDAGYQNFELHPSEETDLVINILGLAGITLKDPGLYQIATAEENKNIQQEKQ